MNEQHPRLLQGQNGTLVKLMVDSGLNEVGMNQAIALAKRLRKGEFDVVYSSDLMPSVQVVLVDAN
jgi:broad specificity phosphatase PhoE